MLGLALIDVVETLLETGEPLPRPDATVTDTEMDLEEPIYLHLRASTDFSQEPVGVVAP